MTRGACPHDDGARATPAAGSCAACGMAHQLRACNACGHVGCADSHQAHATSHARDAQHPIFREVTRDDDGWVWCDACQAYLA